MNNKLYFRAFEYEDLHFINIMRNNENNFIYTCGNKYYTSSIRDKEWIEDKIFNNKTQLYFIICTRSDNIPIGYISVINIDFVNRKAQYGGVIISEKYSGNGYGKEATRLILNHIFDEMGLNMFYGYWREDHKVSIKMGEKNGFKIDGLVRDYVYKQGKFHNAYILSILKSEYDNLKKE